MWLDWVLFFLVVAGVASTGLMLRAACWWLVDRWRDRHDVDDLDAGEPGEEYADELADIPGVPAHAPARETIVRGMAGGGMVTSRQGPAPAADPGWQVTDTGTLFPPLWLADRRPDLVAAIPALGQEWRP
jgi:hypothetical protein